MTLRCDPKAQLIHGNGEGRFFEVNDTCLYTEIAGAGCAVVLLHGFTLDTRMWDDQFLSLARHYWTMRYDLRGFGRSALPTEGPYSHVEDLRALLDCLAIEQATLVGLSKGGAVALDFALTYPHRTQALVLIDTVLGGFAWSLEGSARDMLVWKEAARGGIPAARQSWLTHPLFGPAQQQPAVAARLTQIIEAYSGWHFAHANPEQGLTPPAAQRLAELNMPVLAMVGEYDLPDFRNITELICQQMPQARKVIVPGVGHMANMEAPDFVTQALLEFLGAQRAPIPSPRPEGVDEMTSVQMMAKIIDGSRFETVHYPDDEILLRATDSGNVQVIEYHSTDREGPPAHYHPWHEIEFVIDGEVEFYLHGQWIRGGPGTVQMLPAGVAHSVRVPAGKATLLYITIGAPYDGFARELSALYTSGQVSRESVVAIANRHGVRLEGDTPESG